MASNKIPNGNMIAGFVFVTAMSQFVDIPDSHWSDRVAFGQSNSGFARIVGGVVEKELARKRVHNGELLEAMAALSMINGRAAVWSLGMRRQR